MKNAGKRIGQTLGGIIGFIIVVILIQGFRPVPQDELPEVYGAGASNVQPSVTGLEREYPDSNEPEDNPSTAEKIELGRMLFYDPILSLENDMSCASCHHPDFGFTDGLSLAVGAGGTGAGPNRTGGTTLGRSTPSLWNVTFPVSMFWDGREETVEDQAIVPLQHPDEMGADADSLMEELNDIPEYVSLFEDAFGSEDAITLDNLAKAIAAYERTFITNDSPFDKYAAGDLEALSPAQRRGLTLFRSAALNCFECHIPPTFAIDAFRVIGIPTLPGHDPDPGRAGVTQDGINGAFKVPTLRNIALSAPYMHNGVFATLDEVIDFYAEGVEDVESESMDPMVLRGFDITEQEKQDLIAFLFALTDESQLPEVPTEVPSEFPVVERLDNPARDLVTQYNVPASGNRIEAGEPRTLTVEEGQTIQEVVDQALPGDTIMIPYDIYNERVVIDVNEITILGIPNDAGDWPILDGEDILSEAVISSGNDFEIGFLHVRNYTDNGIIVEGVTGIYMHDLFAENTGTYGLYPVQSTNVLIENSEVTGADDAGIYAGQCENVVIRDSVVYGNVLGIEVENTDGGEVYNNHAYNNTNGIMIVLLPQLTSKVSINTKVYDNLVENNNLDNFAQPNTAAAIMPPGVGIALLSTDNAEVYGNTITGNHTVGIGIFDITAFFDKREFDVAHIPENIYIHDNTFENNGKEPDDLVKEIGVPGADILWDVSGWNVRVDEPTAEIFPPLLPKGDWWDYTYKMYWNILTFLIPYL